MSREIKKGPERYAVAPIEKCMRCNKRPAEAVLAGIAPEAECGVALSFSCLECLDHGERRVYVTNLPEFSGTGPLRIPLSPKGGLN